MKSKLYHLLFIPIKEDFKNKDHSLKLKTRNL